MIRLCIIWAMVATSLIALAQERKVTPVENDDNLTKKPQLHYFDKHGKPLDEPVLIWAEDTMVKTKSKPLHPLYSGVYVGLNFFDGILRLAGQSYANYDISAQVSIYNWFLPTLEVGIGHADSSPADKNFRYKCSPTLYGKLGFDYNFLYNSTPDYSPFVGFRAGLSSFSYSVTDVTVTSDYWDQTNHITLSDQKSTAFYGEVLAGLRVKIWKKISMGWTLRYKFPFHIKEASQSTPWFIPGYGARNAHFTGTFSIIYNI